MCARHPQPGRIRNALRRAPGALLRLSPWSSSWSGAAGESGQTLVLAALAMVVLVAFLGLSIDAGQMRVQKRRMQSAADAAALAGALESSHCNGSASCEAMRTAALDALVENGFTGAALLADCAAGTGARLELSLNNPPCANAHDPHLGNSAYVEAIVSEPQATTFARVLGISSVLLMARGEAALSGDGNCVYALDPAAGGALSMDASAALATDCGIVVESSSSSALDCAASGSITASTLTVTGGYSRNCSVSPAPRTGAATPRPLDPLASLPVPAVPACGASTQTPFHGAAAAINITGTAVLYADAAYCGGITIAQGANVTFNPGTYVLTSQGGAGGMTVSLESAVTGTGVTFYNHGPSGGITFTDSSGSSSSGGVDLTAPLSGTYAGILFFQDPANTTQATIAGSSCLQTVLEGVYYFPKAKVVFGFDGTVAYNALVAYDVEFELFTHAGNSTGSRFRSNYAALANGSPLAGTGAAVVE